MATDPRLRVLLVMLSPSWFGTERHAVQLANALAEVADVALLLRARPPEPARQAQYTAMRQAVAPAVRVFTTPRALPFLGLWQALWRFRPDIVHAHGGRAARIAARFAIGAPVIATVHFHFRAAEFMRCNALISLSEAEARDIPALYPGARFLIGNWTLPHVAPSPARLAELRAEFGLAEDDDVVGSAGRLTAVKGFPGLIDAFAAADLPHARLLIVGDGEDAEKLHARAADHGLKDRIVFAGFRTDLTDIYALFDVFVLNTSYDPYPLVLLEAAAAGLPIIATDIPGPRAIAEKHPIHLVPPDNPHALAAALRTAWDRRAESPPPLRGFAVEDRRADILAAYRQVIARRREAA